MFTPFHLLPLNAVTDGNKYRERWDSDEGRSVREHVMDLIRNRAGEHLLQADYQDGRLGILENEFDLRGLDLFKEVIDFPTADNFKAIDFSYARFYHCEFTNALFNCTMAFTRFYNCTFRRCTFVSNHCYAASFEKVTFIECDFVEMDSFVNCSFQASTFDSCYFSKELFHDCTFDFRTDITAIVERTQVFSPKKYSIANVDRAALYKGIAGAYRAGNVDAKARRYTFLQHQLETRHNTSGILLKLSRYAIEAVTGYGQYPARVLFSMAAWFSIILPIFTDAVGIRDAVVLASGAIFTFGARADLLTALSPMYTVVYIFTSFVGITLVALFVTVSARVLFSSD